MSSIAELQQQKQVFKQAYEAGKITKNEYQQAIAYTQQKIIKASAQKPRAPPGYELVKKETYTPAPLPPQPGYPRKGWDPTRPTQQITEYIYKPKAKPTVIVQKTGSFMGLETYYPVDMAPEVFKRQAVYQQVYNPEERAMYGLTLATTAGTVAAVPIAGIGAVGAIGIAETVKVAIIGEGLTPAEAITAAGIGAVAVIGAEKAYPYVRRGVSRIYGAAFPERAIYKRVVGAQQPKVGIAERLYAKVAPERAMYGRVVKTAPPVETKPPTPYITGGKGAQQWVQQQVLVKQAPVQKAVMKPFLPTVQVPKTVTVVQPAKQDLVKTVTKTQSPATKQATQMQTQQTRTIQQQVANPFLQYRGAPYFRRPAREEYEYVYVSYPKDSPLATPTQISRAALLQRQIQRQTPRTATTPITRGILEQAPVSVLDPLQIQSQSTKQVLEQTQQQRTVQQQVAELTQSQKQMERYWSLGGFDAPAGFSRITSEIIGGYGRYKRRYPLLTAKQMLKEVFG